MLIGFRVRTNSSGGYLLLILLKSPNFARNLEKAAALMMVLTIMVCVSSSDPAASVDVTVASLYNKLSGERGDV